jgi:hypothetical protein
MSNQTHLSLHPSSIQTLTVGPGVPPDPVLLLTLSTRGLYHRSGIHLHIVQCKCHPAPKVFIWLSKLYPAEHKLPNSLAPPTMIISEASGRAGMCPRVFYISVRFDDAVDRAYTNALG